MVRPVHLPYWVNYLVKKIQRSEEKLQHFEMRDEKLKRPKGTLPRVITGDEQFHPKSYQSLGRIYRANDITFVAEKPQVLHKRRTAVVERFIRTIKDKIWDMGIKAARRYVEENPIPRQRATAAAMQRRTLQADKVARDWVPLSKVMLKAYNLQVHTSIGAEPAWAAFMGQEYAHHRKVPTRQEDNSTGISLWDNAKGSDQAPGSLVKMRIEGVWTTETTETTGKKNNKRLRFKKKQVHQRDDLWSEETFIVVTKMAYSRFRIRHCGHANVSSNRRISSFKDDIRAEDLLPCDSRSDWSRPEMLAQAQIAICRIDHNGAALRRHEREFGPHYRKVWKVSDTHITKGHAYPDKSTWRTNNQRTDAERRQDETHLTTELSHRRLTHAMPANQQQRLRLISQSLGQLLDDDETEPPFTIHVVEQQLQTDHTYEWSESQLMDDLQTMQTNGDLKINRIQSPSATGVERETIYIHPNAPRLSSSAPALPRRRPQPQPQHQPETEPDTGLWRPRHGTYPQSIRDIETVLRWFHAKFDAHIKTGRRAAGQSPERVNRPVTASIDFGMLRARMQDFPKNSGINIYPGDIVTSNGLKRLSNDKHIKFFIFSGLVLAEEKIEIKM